MTLVQIRVERALYRIKQQDLAARVGLSSSYLCDVEAGRRKASPALMARIADALDELKRKARIAV